MKLLQQSCKSNFGNTVIQLHFRGDIAVGIQDAAGEKDHSLQCPEDHNQEDMVGVLGGQICKQVEGFGSIIQCIKTTHVWWVYDLMEHRWEDDFKPSTRCDVQCPDTCTCMLTDRQVVYNCSQDIQDLGNTSTRLLLFPSHVSRLDLSQNRIKTLTATTFMNIGKHIRYLDLGFNFLTELPLQSLDYLYNMIYFNCAGNSLVTLNSEIFVKLPSLIFLYSNNNALVTLDAGVFTNLQSLTTLVLSFNQLVTLHPGVFDNLYKLNQLLLTNNSLITLNARLFANLHNLVSLDLDNNALVALEMHIFVNLCKLKYLYLVNNRLDTLNYRTFNKLIELKGLFLNDNRIRHLENGILSNLTHL